MSLGFSILFSMYMCWVMLLNKNTTIKIIMLTFNYCRLKLKPLEGNFLLAQFSKSHTRYLLLTVETKWKFKHFITVLCFIKSNNPLHTVIYNGVEEAHGF